VVTTIYCFVVNNLTTVKRIKKAGAFTYLMEQELSEFGLTEKEIKVYLACLYLGSALVNEIAHRAGTHRTYTYDVLKSLKKQGLVSFVIKSGKQYFEVAKPEKLLSILKEREGKIASILPELNTLYKSAIEKPKVEVYEGKEGLKTIFDDILRHRGELITYGSTEKLTKILQFYFPNFIKLRIKNRVPVRVITERSAESLKIHVADKQELREMRFVAGVQFPSTIYIYGNNVAILSLEKDIVGLLIEDQNIAATQKYIFELLWKQTERK